MMAETVTSDTFNPLHHELSKAIQHELNTLLKDYKSQFAKDDTSIGTTPLTSMTIDTGDSDPISKKPYPIAMKHYQWVKEKIEKLLAAKVIHSSRSSWSAPIIVVPKDDGGKHLVIDYRPLKKVTRKFTWSIPKVEDIFPKLKEAAYFTTLDLQAGYHHIPLDKLSIPKAPAYFQELITGILKDFNIAIAYLDDIIYLAKLLRSTSYISGRYLKKLRSAKLSMEMSKCNFFSKEI